MTLRSGGYVYVATNPSMPGLLKIGFTTSNVSRRITQLSDRTNMPARFEAKFYVETSEPKKLEGALHKTFANQHCSKEFFRIELAEAIPRIKAFLEVSTIPWCDFDGPASCAHPAPVDAIRQARRQETAALLRSKLLEIKQTSLGLGATTDEPEDIEKLRELLCLPRAQLVKIWQDEEREKELAAIREAASARASDPDRIMRLAEKLTKEYAERAVAQKVAAEKAAAEKAASAAHPKRRGLFSFLWRWLVSLAMAWR